MKNVFLTFFFTGVGYAATLTYTYVIIAFAPNESVGDFNRYESFLVIVASFVSLGVVQDATRRIALYSISWGDVYKEAQNLRLLISFGVSILCLVVFFVTNQSIYLLGIVSVFVAMSGDYALYALGRPIEGSLAAMLRSLIYCFVLVGCVFLSQSLNLVQVAAAAISGYVVCGYYVSKRLSRSYFFRPKSKVTTKISTIGFLALTMFTYNNIKPAFIFFIYDYLNAIERVYYFEAFKIYFLIFSVRRVMVQIFYKKIIQVGYSFRYDFYISASVILCLCFLWLVRMVFDIFGLEFKGLSFDLLKTVTFMGLLICFFPSSFTKLFALNKDRYIVIPIVVGLIWLLFGLFILARINSSVNAYLYLLGSTEVFLSIISYVVYHRFLKRLAV